MVTLDGVKVARLRVARGLCSQQVLAEKALLSPRVVWDAENRRPISPRTHLAIAQALDVQPSDLLPIPLRSRAARFFRTRAGVATLFGASLALAATALVAWPHGTAVVPVVRGRAGDLPVRIAAVQFTGASDSYMMTVHGSGFGSSPFAQPFYGVAPYFHIADITQRFEAGYPGDNEKIRYEHWSNRRIVVAEVQAIPGDCIGLMLWNPVTHVGAAWGGNVPPILLGTPRIRSARFSANGNITLVGSNFGGAPFAAPFSSNDNLVRLADAAYHPWGTGPSVPFDIGGKWTNTKLRFAYWADRRIVIAGFSGAPLPDGMKIEPGDPVTVVLWNPHSHLATAWGGTAR